MCDLQYATKKVLYTPLLFNITQIHPTIQIDGNILYTMEYTILDQINILSPFNKYNQETPSMRADFLTRKIICFQAENIIKSIAAAILL